jgi:hypothetical protein
MNPGIQQPAGLGIPERLFPDMPGRFMPSTAKARTSAFECHTIASNECRACAFFMLSNARITNHRDPRPTARE